MQCFRQQVPQNNTHSLMFLIYKHLLHIGLARDWASKLHLEPYFMMYSMVNERLMISP
jgi:hypothetical protein